MSTRPDPLFPSTTLFRAILTFITLCACRHVAAGRPMLLTMWLEPLRDRETRRRLFGLGLAYLAFCMMGGFLATLPFIDNLMTGINADGAIDEHALLAAMQGPLLTLGLLYVVISALFWHAPALIGWHGISMRKALSYSMVARTEEHTSELQSLMRISY